MSCNKISKKFIKIENSLYNINDIKEIKCDSEEQKCKIRVGTPHGYSFQITDQNGNGGGIYVENWYECSKNELPKCYKKLNDLVRYHE